VGRSAGPSRRRVGWSTVALLLAAVVAPAAPLPAAADSCTLAGAGTEAAPYLVTTVEDLAQVAAVCHFMAHYVQTADLHGVTTPIGTATLFSGSYRGGEDADPWAPARRQVTMAIDAGEGAAGPSGLFATVRDATISDLELHGTIRSPANGTGALIGQAAGSLTVRDVITHVTVTGGGAAGGLVGWAFVGAGTVVLERITITGSVLPDAATVDASAGGLAGQLGGTLDDGTITIADVIVESEVIGGRTEDGSLWTFTSAGGLVGSLFSGQTSFGGGIEVGASGSPVQVVGPAAAGGLLGTFGVTSGPTTLAGVTVRADVSSPGSMNSPRTGGIVGYVSQGAGGLSLEDMSFSGTVTGSSALSASTGGAVGSTFAVDHLVLHDVQVDAIVTGEGSVGGAVGFVQSVARLVLGDGERPVTVGGSVSGGQGPVGGAVATVRLTGTAAPGFVLDHVTVTASPITGPSGQGVGGLVGLLETVPTSVVTFTDVAVGAPGAPVSLVPSRAGLMLGSGGLVGSVTNPDRMDVERATVVVDIAPDAGTRAQAVGGAIGNLNACGAIHLQGVAVSGDISGAADVGGLVGRVRDGWLSCPDVARGLTVAPSGPTASDVTADITSAAAAGGVVASAQGGSALTLDAVTVAGSVTGGTLVGGVVGESRLPALTITGGTMDAIVTASATETDAWLRAGGLVGEVRSGTDATASLVISGTTLGPGAQVRAAHPTGSSDAAVLVAGGVASYGTTGAPAAVELTGVPTIDAAALDVGAVAAAIVAAGRCLVASRANVVQWAAAAPASDVTALRRVEPPSPDPCPEPAGGFGLPGVGAGAPGGPGAGGGGAGPILSCTAPALVVGAVVTCRVAAGPVDADVRWRAAVNPEVASGVLRTDGAGAASFAFRLTAATRGRTVTVELVDWTAPLPIGVVGDGLPLGVAAGGGTAGDVVRMAGSGAPVGLVVGLAATLLASGRPGSGRAGRARAGSGLGPGRGRPEVGG
jgi:hypothetical protein